MDPIGLIQGRHQSHALQEKGIERHLMLFGKAGKDVIEGGDIVRAQVQRRTHADQQNRNIRSLKAPQDRLQILIGRSRLQAPQGIVGAELQEHRIRPFGEAPVEACQPASGGVAGIPAVQDLDGPALRLQSPLQLSGKFIALGQTIAMDQAVTERQQPDGLGG